MPDDYSKYIDPNYKGTSINQVGSVEPIKKVQAVSPDNVFLKIPAKNASLSELAGIGTRAVSKGLSELVDTFAGAPNNEANYQMEGVEKLARALGDTKAADAFKQANQGQKPLDVEPVTTATQNLLNALHVSQPITNNEKLASKAITTATQFAVPLGETKLGDVIASGIAGAASGAAEEAARQSGAGQGVAGVIGLAVGASGLIIGHHITSRFGKSIANTVKDIPPEQVFTEEGHLTDEGQNIVSKLNVNENDLKAAYEEALANTETHINRVKQARQEGIDAGLPEDHPTIKLADDIINKVEDVKAKVDEKLNPRVEYESSSPIDTRTPEQRVNDAKSLYASQGMNIEAPLTSGQSNNDFLKLQKEQDLTRRSDNIGNEARTINEQQQNDVKTLGDSLVNAFDNPNLDKAQKGEIIQKAVSTIKEGRYEDVKKIYTQLSNIKDAPKVDPKPIFEEAYNALDKFGEGDNRSIDMLKRLAKYDAIPKEFIEQSTYNPILKQSTIALKDGTQLKVRGEVEPLNLANSEKLNQSLNELYNKDTINPQFGVKKAIDQAVQDTLEKEANKNTQAAQIAQKARSEYRDYAEEFKGKDIISQLSDVKEGTKTPVINPDRVLDLVLGAKSNINNIKKLKALLLAKPETRKAWDVIKGYAQADIIKPAINEKGISYPILSNKLRNMGDAKLKLLFDPSEYNNLMKLKRLAKDVSSTGIGTAAPIKNHLINLIYHTAKFSLLGIGHGASHLASLAMFGGADVLTKLKADREAIETLEAMKNYKGTIKEVSNPKLDNNHLKHLLNYISSKEFILPLLQSHLHGVKSNVSN